MHKACVYSFARNPNPKIAKQKNRIKTDLNKYIYIYIYKHK